MTKTQFQHFRRQVLAAVGKRLPEPADVIFLVGLASVVGGVAHFSRALAAIVAGTGLIWMSLLLGAAVRRAPSAE